MAVHPAGDGVSWTTDVDVDQPHGLDYRYINHVAIGVASRINKEHKTFADATVGGEHLAGGCNVLLLDTTANMVADGTIIAGGLACASSGARAGLYFFNDATVAQNVPVTNASMCLGDDFSWAGHHEFDSTVNFFKAVDMSTVTMDGSLVQTGSSDMSSISSDGTCTFLDEVDISTLNVDASAGFKGEVDFSTVNIDGTAFFTDISMTGISNLFGDFTIKETADATLVKNVVYQAQTDGFALVTSNGGNLTIFSTEGTVANVLRSKSSTADNVPISVIVPIPRSHHFEISISGGALTQTYWMPVGVGGVTLI